MKRIVRIVLAAVLVALGGCGRGAVEARLDVAEELMEERPDSALVVLDELSGSKLRGEERARYALLLSQAYDKNYIDVTDDSLISVARNYYAESDDSYHQMLAEYYFARVKMNGNDPHSAMMPALKAEKIANNSENYLNLARVQSLLSDIYATTYNIEKALEYNQKDLINSRLANKKEWEATAMISLAYKYISLEMYEKAIAYVDSARVLGEVVDYEDLRILIYSYVRLNQYESADSVYKIAEKNGIELAPSEYAHVALANHHLGNQTRCDGLIRRAFAAISTKQDSIDVNAMWYRISMSRGNYKEAVKAQQVILDYTDVALDEATENSIHLVQVENERLNAAQQAAANEIRQLKAIATIAVMALILVLLCYLILLLKRKYTHKIEERDSQIKERDYQIKERDYQINERDHQINERDSAIKERDHKIEERDHKLNIFTKENNKLKQDSKLLQQRIDELNGDLQNLRQKEEFAQFTWTEKLGDIYVGAKNTHSAQQVAFKRLENVFEQIRDKKTQNKLERIINSQRNNLIMRLRTECPKLIDSEIRLIIYSGAGFSAKILAEIFEKRESAIRIQKHRIKVKIETLYPDFVPEMRGVI